MSYDKNIIKGQEVNIIDKILVKAKKYGYICPFCNNGSGKNGTGATINRTKDGIICINCKPYKKHNVFDVVGAIYGLDTLNEQINKCVELLGITEEYIPQPTTIPTQPKKPIGEAEPKKQCATIRDFKKWVIARKQSKEAKDYLFHRGISEATADKYYIGYDKKSIIIPINSITGSYIQRLIYNRSDGVKCYKRGTQTIFNAKNIDKAENFIFIVEGEFDALSIIELGYCAISIGGVGNIEKLKSLDFKNKIVVSLMDNDEAGQQAQKEIYSLFGNRIITFVHIPVKYKDCNEFLVNNRKEMEMWFQYHTEAKKHIYDKILNDILNQ